MKPHHLPIAGRARSGFLLLLAAGLAAGLALGVSRLDAAPKKQRRPFFAQKPIAPPPPRSALLTVEDWQKAPLTRVQPAEIDRLVARELQADKVAPAPLTTDEQFIRRATLDLTGELPRPAEVEQFVADMDAGKRARLIDRLLDSDAYARHWSRYWLSVITARLEERRGLLLAPSFEKWMHDQLRRNTSWGDIATAMITAEGPCRYDQLGKNGAAFFLLSHLGPDADSERAAETSRVFLGIQIQCAQCHNHPFDQWKRVQFHELAGYFARLRQRPVREGMNLAKGKDKGKDKAKSKDKKKKQKARVVGIELVSVRRGEHLMPSMTNPKDGEITPPRFLDGKVPGMNLGDRERRRALARAIVDRNNYWFAGAYVNRIWGVLMGQAFCEPVDDLGPKKEVTFPKVLTRLTGSFRATGYDMKALFRDLMNSATYQRQIRLSEDAEQHPGFAAAYPTRLSADTLWQSLVSVLGPMGAPPPKVLAQLKKKRPFFRNGFEALFKQTFAFDPSLKSDDIEGSISQALLLMNNPVINQRILARGNGLLAQTLKTYADDDEALQHLYLRVLARKPTDRELARCRDYIQNTDKRPEAFEDILWALLNSTEFQTKR